MRRWRYPFSLIGFGSLFLLLILSRIPSIQAAEILTLAVADSSELFGELGTPFNLQFTASGGATGAIYGFDLVSGIPSLPPGTFFSGSTGRLTNTPTTEGAYSISVQAIDDASNTSPVMPFTLCVGIAISPATLPDITATVAYTSAAITTSCASGTVMYGLSGAPVGITIDPLTGVISGTTAQEGPFTLRVTVTDAQSRSSFKDYTVNSNYPALISTPANLANGFINTAYTSTITFTGRPRPLLVTLLPATLLPAGLTATPTNGTATTDGRFVLSGTPTELTVTGTSFQVAVRVTDANLRATDLTFPFTISVASLVLGPSSLPNATQGVAYSQQLTASGGTAPYEFSLASGTTMPAGLSLTLGGLIDGVPTAPPNSYAFTVNVFDSSSPQRIGTRVYTLQIVGGLTPAYGSFPPVGGAINFGLVTTPGTDVTQALTVTNSGGAILNVSAPSSSPIFTGPQAADFRFGGSVFPPFGVAAGGASVTVFVVCRPNNTLFASTAVMTFRTNDPLRPSVSYNLSCNQVIPTATPGIGTPTAISATAGPSVLVIGRATAVVTEAPDTFATVTFVKGLALRSGPYLGSTMLGVIRPKKDYPVLGMNGGDGEGNFNWYLIVDVDNKRIGWASGRYLILRGDPNIPFTTTVFDQSDNTRDVGARLTIFGNVNIRARPSDRMPVVHTTAYGTELEIIGRTMQAGVTQWVHVRFYDPATGRAVIGWVYYNFNAPELMKLTGIAPLDAVPLR